MKKEILIALLLLVLCKVGVAQCPYTKEYIPKTKGITYTIDATLDNEKKSVDCRQSITWTNPSPDTIYELRMYMYLNAFSSLKTTYLRSSGGKVFGNDISNRLPNEWGWQRVSEIKISGLDHLDSIRYIQPDDGNINDETVLSIPLKTPCLPYQSIVIDMEYEAKLPRTIARAGYGLNDYYLFVHWFPQMGVYEQDEEGVWYWNCHQFMMQTEFYADFSDFKVTLRVPSHLTLGASGCIVDKVYTKDSTTYVIDARDIIDFAWTAYPLFDEYNYTYKGTDIKLLVPPEHCNMVERYHEALRHCLDYFAEHFEPYPYPSITLVDPPLHTLNSGFMEYPMLITCASFAYVPEGIKTVESLAVHEFSHQYFMGILASNEKEAPWLDEGFVTYLEDEIVDTYYGENSNSSLFNILGYRSANIEQSRAEYVSLNHSVAGPIARPGWEFQNSYKGIIYAKTATMLQTLKGLIGKDKMKQLLKSYYLKHRFTHPREYDWIAAMKDNLGEEIEGMPIDTFNRWCLHTSWVCDYSVEEVVVSEGRTSVKCANLGKLYFPVEVTIELNDGTITTKQWSYDSSTFETIIDGKVSRVWIDKQQKIKLDLNTINNNWVADSEKDTATKSVIQGGSVLQRILSFINILA